MGVVMRLIIMVILCIVNVISARDFVHSRVINDNGYTYSFASLFGLGHSYDDIEKSTKLYLFADVGANTHIKLPYDMALRFGVGMLGNIWLNDATHENGKYVGEIYQAYAGFDSEYFLISLGREELDLEWVNDFVQGGRASFLLPQYDLALNVFYFNALSVADLDELVAFKDNEIGSVFVANLKNTIDWYSYELYYILLDKFYSSGLNMSVSFDHDNGILLDTTLKYMFAYSKQLDAKHTHFVNLEQIVMYKDITFLCGMIKMFNNAHFDILDIAKLGDQNPLEMGESVYDKNALSFYTGISYVFDNIFNVGFVYGNTKVPNYSNINELDLFLEGNYKGFGFKLLYASFQSPQQNGNTNNNLIKGYVYYNF